MNDPLQLRTPEHTHKPLKSVHHVCFIRCQIKGEALFFGSKNAVLEIIHSSRSHSMKLEASSPQNKRTDHSAIQYSHNYGHFGNAL